mgnify:FL=1
MLRSVSMDEISDGKLYSSSDMVRADSLGCDGCMNAAVIWAIRSY